MFVVIAGMVRFLYADVHEFSFLFVYACVGYLELFLVYVFYSDVNVFSFLFVCACVGYLEIFLV